VLVGHINRSYGDIWISTFEACRYDAAVKGTQTWLDILKIGRIMLLLAKLLNRPIRFNIMHATFTTLQSNKSEESSITATR
jgi:hypothetical protein